MPAGCVERRGFLDDGQEDDLARSPVFQRAASVIHRVIAGWLEIGTPRSAANDVSVIAVHQRHRSFSRVDVRNTKGVDGFANQFSASPIPPEHGGCE